MYNMVTLSVGFIEMPDEVTYLLCQQFILLGPGPFLSGRSETQLLRSYPYSVDKKTEMILISIIIH